MRCATHNIHEPSTQGILQHTHCNTLQHTATHCNTLHHTATHCNKLPNKYISEPCTQGTLQYTATHCRTLQHIATHCNTLQHTAIHCTASRNFHATVSQQHTATHCNTLQHTVTHRNTPQHTAAYCKLQHMVTYCNTLQHTATNCTASSYHYARVSRRFTNCCYILLALVTLQNYLCYTHTRESDTPPQMNE